MSDSQLASRPAVLTLLALVLAPHHLTAQDPHDLVQDLTGPRADAARAALEELGPRAVDALIEAGASDAQEVRVRCLELLARLGLRAGDVVDRIVQSYPNQVEDPAEFVALLDALGAVLPNSERLRQERLAMGRPGEWKIPDGCLALLHEIGCRAHPSGELAARLRLAQGRMEVRAFFLLGPDSETTELVAALEDELTLLRELAAELLGAHGADAAEAVPALADVLRREHVRDKPRVGRSDHTDVVHAAAARAILAIDPEHPESALAHAWTLRHGTADERFAAAVALTRLGATAREAVPALIEVLAEPGSRPALEAIVALGAVGPAAKEALPRLRELATSEDPQVARRSAAAIAAIERDGRARRAP